MVTTRKGKHLSTSTRSRTDQNQSTTDVRRSKRNIASTPAGTVAQSPDHVLNIQFDSGAATKPAGNKSKSRISAVCSTRKKSKLPDKPVPEINILTPPCLIEIFKRCGHKSCLYVLPLVCKQWAELLRASSAAWENLTISNDVEITYGKPPRHRVLGYGKVLKWITPRAQGVINLTLIHQFFDLVAHEDSEIAAANFSSILKTVGPTLKSLSIKSVSNNGFGFKLKWSVLKDIADAANTLTSLELHSIDDGQLTSAHVEDLKKLKHLERLTLEWKPSSVASPVGVNHLVTSTPAPDGTPALPSSLFDLRQLQYLSLSSSLITGSFPKDIQRLVNLNELKLENTNLSKIESLPSSLYKLSISGSVYGPQILENGFWQVVHTTNCLSELNMSKCNLKRLNILSSGLEFNFDWDVLSRIKKFNVSHNPLGDLTLSDMIYEMSRLKELDLSSCGLSVIPEAATEYWDEIEILNLNHNNLVDLPKDMEELRSLKVFKAQFNSFPAIPEILKKMPTLVTINLGGSNYLEVSKSISEWLLEKKNLKRVSLMKLNDASYQASSKLWLEEAERELAHVGRHDVLIYDHRTLNKAERDY